MNIMDIFHTLPTGEQFHGQRVAAISRMLAELMGLSSPEADAIEHSALLHDIGKVMVPQALLRVPHELSKEDRPVVLSHTAIGKRLLDNRESFLTTSAIVAQQHHEYLDGSGYLGLTEKEIHPHAKLVAAADVFDKLTFCQPGEDAIKADQAGTILRQCAGTKLDRQVVLTLLDRMDRAFEVGHEVMINTFFSQNAQC